jgi:hypothetical protein
MKQFEILNLFEKYLELRGYSSKTPSGNRSTTYDYSHIRIPFVLQQEKVTIQVFIESIDQYITEYNVGGSKDYLGQKSHNSVINALKRFKEFLNDQYYNR